MIMLMKIFIWIDDGDDEYDDYYDEHDHDHFHDDHNSGGFLISQRLPL